MSDVPRTIRAEDLTPDVFAELGGSADVSRALRDGSLVIHPRGYRPPAEPTAPSA